MNFINRKTRSKQIQKNQHDTELKLRSYAFLTEKELFAKLSSAQGGLTSHEVEKRKDDFGKNVITIGNKNTISHRLVEAVINPFNVILLLVAE